MYVRMRACPLPPLLARIIYRESACGTLLTFAHRPVAARVVGRPVLFFSGFFFRMCFTVSVLVLDPSTGSKTWDSGPVYCGNLPVATFSEGGFACAGHVGEDMMAAA